MQITKCEFLRFALPFRASFKHAAAERSCSDTILVCLHDESGNRGFGEILAREYVTGETNDEIFQESGPVLAASLIGQRFEGQDEVVDFLREEFATDTWGPALFGGIELALINLFEQRADFSYPDILGEPRRTTPGKCVTIGFEASLVDLKKLAFQAVLSGASAVKLKVGGSGDCARVHRLCQHLRDKIPMRLDANGSFTWDTACRFLRECADTAISSLEQPFAADAPELDAMLRSLYGECGVPLVADESLCRVKDAERWAESGAYQIFNVRVGKCGGLLGVVAIMDIARQSGIGLVAGTMVGESGVLNRGSELLLAHSEDLDYVEGLGQNKRLLEVDPVTLSDEGTTHTFALSDVAIEHHLIDRRVITE
ncbi:MAG: mandelate racemase/muconate lactonizing enzyme family protein [Gemmatimonadales bacterium]